MKRQGRILLPRFGRIRLPAALLAAILQRAPVARMAALAAGFAVESPMGAVIRAAAASLAALGAVDSVAGATTYTLTTGSPAHPSPYTVAAGSQMAAVIFQLVPSPSNAPGSWTVSGTFPPGLMFGVPGDFITSDGTVNEPYPAFFGTPTTPGSYPMTLEAFEYTEAGGLTSGTFGYEIDVVPANANPPPVFTTQPVSATVTGGTVALYADASNAPSYQWSLNGSPVPNATDPILLITDAAASAGTYTCAATNPGGSATSNPATVTLTSTTDIGRLVNISCRAEVGTGGNVLISGFVVGGAGTSGTEPLLIRASGPALAAAPFNVAGTLSDPELELDQSNPNGTSTLLVTNNGWGGNSTIASTAAAVGAFSWNNPSSHDAAILDSLDGPYTAQVSGQSGDTGVALAEVYDATPSYTAASPRLINISARVQVGTGGNVLIAGFVIGGTTSRTVLIRASGPALAAAPFNVSGTLPDPELALNQSNANGTSTLLASDDGWGGRSEIVSTASAVGAFPWGNPGSADSALLVTLPPGAYTAQVSGASGDTGVALIEVYEVP